MDSNSPGCGPVVGCSEYGIEISGSVKGGKFLNQLLTEDC